jgi:hypothetical protein
VPVENATPDTAYLTKTNVGPAFTKSNIVEQIHTVSDALPAAAKTQHLTKADLEVTAREARGRTELGGRNGATTSSGGSIERGR